MLNSKMYKCIWTIILIISIVAISLYNVDTYLIYTYAILTAILFLLDYLNLAKYYREKMNKITKNWHIFSNISQWLFWTFLVYMFTESNMSYFYKTFIIIDLTVVSTFAQIKFKKSLK